MTESQYDHNVQSIPTPILYDDPGVGVEVMGYQTDTTGAALSLAAFTFTLVTITSIYENVTDAIRAPASLSTWLNPGNFNENAADKINALVSMSLFSVFTPIYESQNDKISAGISMPSCTIFGIQSRSVTEAINAQCGLTAFH